MLWCRPKWKQASSVVSQKRLDGGEDEVEEVVELRALAAKLVVQSSTQHAVNA